MVLVDNGCTTDAVELLRDVAGVTVVTPGTNTGFAGGCNLGARHAVAPVLAFVNGDAVVRPGALRALVDTSTDDAVGLASGSLRLYDEPDVMNSAGNPVHFTGLSWAGGLGEPGRRPHRAAGRGLGDRRRDSRPGRPVRRARRLLRADVRLLRGRRAVAAHLAARLARALRPGRGGAAPLRVLPQRRSRATCWSATACSWSPPCTNAVPSPVLLPVLVALEAAVAAGGAAAGLVPREGTRLVVAVAAPLRGRGAAAARCRRPDGSPTARCSVC